MSALEFVMLPEAGSLWDCSPLADVVPSLAKTGGLTEAISDETAGRVAPSIRWLMTSLQLLRYGTAACVHRLAGKGVGAGVLYIGDTIAIGVDERCIACI